MRDIAKKIAADAMKAGAESVEVYFEKSVTSTVEAKSGELDFYGDSTSSGFALRVIADGRPGFAFTTLATQDEIARCVRSAVENAKNNDPDEIARKAAGQPLQGERDRFPQVNVWHESTAGMPDADKIALALKLEQSARETDRRIDQVRKAICIFADYESGLVDSHGLDISHKGTIAVGSVMLTARDSSGAEMGYESDYHHDAQKLDVTRIGRDAAKKACALLGARPVKTCAVPAILVPDIASEFIEIIGSSISAESAQKGKSMLAGKLGTKVAADCVTVVDDATREQSASAQPFDSEGSPSRATTVIDGGKFKSFLHNRYTAAKENGATTGNAVRGGIKSAPGVGIRNLMLLPGRQTEEGLLAGIEEGFYITEAMGTHTADPVTGDFSFGASGFWIKNGKLGRPVRGVTVAGNIIDLFLGIDAVADNLRYFHQSASPSVRVARLTVAGE